VPDIPIEIKRAKTVQCLTIQTDWYEIHSSECPSIRQRVDSLTIDLTKPICGLPFGVPFPTFWLANNAVCKHLRPRVTIELNFHYGSQLGRVFASIEIGAFRSCGVFQNDYNSTKPI
jgi:hypothetical protein